MTFHPRSVVEFGLFFTQVSDSLVSGAPLAQAVELIRRQLGGAAAAIRIEDRLMPGHGVVVVAEGREVACPSEGRDDPVAGESVLSTTPHEEARLSELLETSHHAVATTVSEVDGTRYTLWVFREPGDEGFDTGEVSLCEILVAQLRRGVELSARLGATETERALYSSVMDRLFVGVVILDPAGKVVKTSATADDLLAGRDGLLIQAGRLRATCAKEDRDLQQAIKTASQSVASGEVAPARGLSFSRPSAKRNLGVVVQPIVGRRQSNVVPPAAVAVYIRDPDANADVEGDLVRQLFDLTPAEAAVARRLAAGLSLEAAASSLAISRNTARAHLRSIFSKSGITRQTELVRLMLNSAAMLGERPRQVA